MGKSVKKKRSGRRASALVGALLLLLSVLTVPASAVTMIGQVIEPDGSFDVGAYNSSYDYHWIENIFLNQVTYEDPYTYSWINISPEFNSAVGWSYVSFQFSMLTEEWHNLGHYTIGMYTADGSDFYVRIGDNYTSIYPVDVPVNGGDDIWAGYRITRVGDYNDENGSPYMIECQFRVLRDGVIVQSENVYRRIPYNVYGMSLELKTEYAGVSADGVSDAEDIPHMPSDLRGMIAAYNKGQLVGIDRAEKDAYRTLLWEPYVQAGGMEDLSYDKIPNVYDGAEKILRYFEDRGWTECADQGALTTKLIFTALEAPVNVILGGLDFTVFGINLAQTLFAVLAIIIIFAIIRIVLAVLPLV